jgi:Tfp pilus assembly protein PilF
VRTQCSQGFTLSEIVNNSAEKFSLVSPLNKRETHIRLLAILVLLTAVARGQDPGKDPAYNSLTKAFDALRTRDYDGAVAWFDKAAKLSPGRGDIRKNLAYTLLKTGETEAAREQFGEAVKLDPADTHVALEYAFLCFEARDNAPARKAEARRIFARVRDTTSDGELRATATEAFRNIDEPLGAGIARWQQVLATSKPTFSAHYELAQLAEQRDETALAAANYRAAFQLLPERKSVLLELARVEKSRENNEGSIAALLAASRGGEPRAAELAREQLPERYPYVYEFRKALELDAKNNTLHRELAYLLLSMSEKDAALRGEAEQEFQSVVAASPEDYLAAAQLGLLWLADHRDAEAMPILKSVLAHADAATGNRVRMALHMPLVLEERSSAENLIDPRTLGERSFNAGFMKDALRFYLQAREADPVDASVALKLGWTNNMLHDDATALGWFNIARHSADSAIAAEAQKAYQNLRPGLQRIRTTVWIYPLYSSRWSDLFGYGQMKTELRVKKLPIHPYLSVRYVGDVRRVSADITPQSLSESAFVVGAGVATQQWHGAVGWFEAGEAFSYLRNQRWKDLRGGISYSRTTGAALGGEKTGMFLETTADSVFVSHFQNNLINYSQNKVGYTVGAGPLRAQAFWAANVVFDVNRQYWANFSETGPGIRFHPPGLPKGANITVNAIHGVYLKNEGNPRRPNFNDFRVGLWYAFTK